jgi:hypothetical protein
MHDRLSFNFAPKGLGYTLGDSFSNSSGHPGRQLHNARMKFMSFEKKFEKLSWKQL